MKKFMCDFLNIFKVFYGSQTWTVRTVNILVQILIPIYAWLRLYVLHPAVMEGSEWGIFKAIFLAFMIFVSFIAYPCFCFFIRCRRMQDSAD